MSGTGRKLRGVARKRLRSICPSSGSRNLDVPAGGVASGTGLVVSSAAHRGFHPNESTPTRTDAVTFIGSILDAEECGLNKPIAPQTFSQKGSGAGDGNRTHVSSLGSYSSTIELHPRSPCLKSERRE